MARFGPQDGGVRRTRGSAVQGPSQGTVARGRPRSTSLRALTTVLAAAALGAPASLALATTSGAAVHHGAAKSTDKEVLKRSVKRAPVVVDKARRGALGTILVTAHGAALYRYGPDTADHPTCTGACLTAWPPLLLPAGDRTPRGGRGVSGLGTVSVGRGRLQVTYHRIPLYTFVSDTGTHVTGQDVGGFTVVHLAATAASGRALTTKPPSRGTTTTTGSSYSGSYGY